MAGRWVSLLKELYNDFELKKLLPNNLLLRCWISQYIFPPYAPGIPIEGDSTHVTEHGMQAWKDATIFKLLEFLFNGLQGWLVSLEFHNNYWTSSFVDYWIT